MTYLLEGIQRVVRAIHGAFRESPHFGLLVLGLLGTALLFSPFGGTYFEAIKYPWAVAVLGGGLLLFARQVVERTWSLYLLTSLALVVWAGISAMFSPSVLVAIVGNFPRYNSSVLLFAFFVCVLWLTIAVVRADKTDWLVRALLVVGGFAGGFAILQFYGLASYTGIDSFFLAVPNRVGSLLGNPNFSSLFLAGVLPFALVRTVYAKTREGQWSGFAISFIVLWSLALFASRGAVLAATVGVIPVLVWVLWQRQWRRATGLILGLFACAFLFSGYFFFYRGESAGALVTAQDASAVDRYVAWGVAGDLLKEHPWLGYGPASFQQYYWERLPSGLMAEGLYFDDAHNTLIHIAAAIGIPGLLFFVLLIGLATARGVGQVWRMRTSAEDTIILVAAGGALGAWVLGSSFNPVTPALYMQLAIVLGLLYAPPEGEQAPNGTRPRGVRLVFVLSGVLLAVYGVCMIVGNQLFIVATRYHGQQKFSQAYAFTKLANRFDPLSPLLQVARVATMQSAGVPPAQVREQVQRMLRASWATSPRIALQIADIAGQLFFMTGDQQDVALVEQALGLARAHGPTYPDAFVQSAYYAALFNKPNDAVRYGQQGVLLQPKNYLTWLVMARAYQAAGEYNGLQLALRKTHSLRPYDKMLPVLRARLEETRDVNSIGLLSQKTFTLISLQ